MAVPNNQRKTVHLIWDSTPPTLERWATVYQRLIKHNIILTGLFGQYKTLVGMIWLTDDTEMDRPSERITSSIDTMRM
jgi:hypothetical protein